MIVLGAVTPHPPIIVPAVGRGELAKVAATRAAMERLAAEIAAAQPETIVLISPHGNVFSDGVAVTGTETLAGSLAQFGDAETHSWRNDLELAEEIVAQAGEAGLTAVLLREGDVRQYGCRTALDHGVLVPLSFLKDQARSMKLVVAGMSFLPLEDLYRVGQAIAAAVEELDRRVVIVASGDLSHRLTPEAPAGYDPRGKEFDHHLVDLLRQADVPGILKIDPVLAEKAGECGYRSIVMMLGGLDGLAVKAEVLSYEGPFGVGYAVASFRPIGTDPARQFGPVFRKTREERVNAARQGESPLVRLARETIEAYVRRQPMPEAHDLPPEAAKRAGAFVSLKKHGQLRGCIGTTEPTRPNLAEEIRANAISAATRDPRFEPVAPNELADLVYSVDVLAPAEPIESMAELDPERYGVIVSRGGRQGLLLPHLEGIETAEEQVAIARRKAGIGPDEEVRLQRFEVKRYH